MTARATSVATARLTFFAAAARAFAGRAGFLTLFCTIFVTSDPEEHFRAKPQPPCGPAGLGGRPRPRPELREEGRPVQRAKERFAVALTSPRRRGCEASFSGV
jgi:hypothetical protein